MRAGLVAGSVSRRAMPLPPPALRHPTALIVFSLLLLALAAAVPSVDAAYRGASFLPTAADEIVRAGGTGLANNLAIATCPAGKSIIWGFKWSWSTDQDDLPSCFADNNGPCNIGATSCSSSECSQSTTKQYIIIVCRAGAAITGLTQRTAYGAGAQPAACPTGTVIAYGFSFYMSDGLRDTNCLYNNKVCDLGQQSCSTSSCSTRHCGGSGGDEYSFIYLLCMPSAAVTLSSGDFVSKTGTSGADSVACPDTSNYKIKFGVAMHESGFYYDQNPSNCLMLNNQAATYNSDILNHVACDTYDDSCNNDQFFLHAICVDVSAPSTPSITSPTQNQVFRTNSVSWTFTTATDAQSDIDHYECQFSSSGAWTTCISNQVSTLDVGTYSFQVRAVNGAGLTSSSSSRAFSVACSLDLTAPVAIPVLRTPMETRTKIVRVFQLALILRQRMHRRAQEFALTNAQARIMAIRSTTFVLKVVLLPTILVMLLAAVSHPAPMERGYYAEPTSKVCVQTCPGGTYGDGLRTPPSCSASCTSGTFKDDASHSCVTNCPANSCASTCSVEFAYNATWSCVSPCPVGYADNSTQSCVTRCPSGTFASKASRQCVAACPKGEVPNSATNTCTAAASSDSSPAVGIAVGVACGVLVIIILVLVLLRRKRRQSKQPEPGNVTNPLYEASAPECPAADYMMHSNSSFAPLTANDQPAGKSASSMRGVRPAQLASHAYGPVSADGSVRGAADTTGSSPAAPPAPLPKPAVSTAPKPAVSKAPKPVAPPKPVVAAPEPTPAAKRVPKPVQSPHVPLSAHTIEHGVAPRALGIDVNETSEYATIKGSSAASPPAEEVYSMVKREEAAETVYVALDV
ncbi:hypothetical protein CAOG_08062 [Capsaspora owczarzaki ATCC 30864]|uniref:hypothetical protein n=1 Tax=Capsaspora owczarzaki (strain ATCC 30864) TaxID=595528 RepID=UPI0003521318|nr:hypothetical protein CAOG_08062 [Capsaspora owczarzaki ATCC 30864]|eukprot:XP_004342663.2 hypothetical protein CAOG_08062 [Capsaspora owczarzaki ATCC 30864]